MVKLNIQRIIFQNLKAYYKKIVPFVDFYKKQIEYYKCMAYEILTKEIVIDIANIV